MARSKSYYQGRRDERRVIRQKLLRLIEKAWSIKEVINAIKSL